MSFLEALLNILAILGIITAGGFIVFFLGDLLLSVLDPHHKAFGKKNKDKYVSSYEHEEENYPIQQQEFTMDDEPAKTEISEEKFSMEDDVKPVNYDNAIEEKGSLNDKFTSEEYKVEETDTKNEDVNSTFNDSDFNFDDDFDFDKLFDENNDVEKTENAIAETTPPEVDSVALTENNDEELLNEIQTLKNELDEQKRLYDDLKSESQSNAQKWAEEKIRLETLYNNAEIQETEKSRPLLTMEEYVARLETLRLRLKANEKDLKANKKEFIPLKRVRKNLDKDKEKLRRREALVAKQKVMLYGVNNIGEIDQEKAKKLAEDLDLLDGLKVSVRHCEEVMEANKERYPILETANRILTTNHAELKADIEECEKNIRQLKIKNGEDPDQDGAELIMNATNTIQNTNDSDVKVVIAPDGSVITQPKRKRGRPRKNTVIEKEPTPQKENLEKQETPVVETQPTETKETLNTSESELDKKDEYTNINIDNLNFDEKEPTFEELFEIEEENKTNEDK